MGSPNWKWFILGIIAVYAFHWVMSMMAAKKSK